MEPSDPNGIERVFVALMVPVDLGWSGLRSAIRIFVAAVGRAAAVRARSRALASTVRLAAHHVVAIVRR